MVPKKAQPCSGEAREKWIKEWGSDEGREVGEDKATLRDWLDRLKGQREWSRRRRPRRAIEATDEASPQDFQARKLHKHLTKAKSSLLVQTRTGAIGLGAFLFSRRVPSQPSPWCSCGEGRETVAHLVVRCSEVAAERELLLVRIADERELRLQLADKPNAPKIVSWLLSLGRLKEYRLALELQQESTMEAWETGATSTGVVESESSDDEEGPRRRRRNQRRRL